MPHLLSHRDLDANLGIFLIQKYLSLNYRKIPKISPGAYIFQRPFLRGLFLEGLIFGGAYVQRENCISKSIGLACSGKGIYHFCFVLLCILGQIPSTSPPGGLYSEGQFNGGFFGVTILGGLYMEGLIFGILRYASNTCVMGPVLLSPTGQHGWIC